MKDSEYWKQVRQRIERIKKIDTECQLVFGSALHQYNILATVSEEEIQTFESMHRIQLPAEYRSFLLEFGAGGVGPQYGIYDFREIDPGHVSEWFHLTESVPWSDDSDDTLLRLPGLLTIGTAGCAIDFSIEVNGAQPGTVWVDAGPRWMYSRLGSLREWYEEWLNKIEYGVLHYHMICEWIDQGVTFSQIVERSGIRTYPIREDEGTFVRFKNVPGIMQIQDDHIVKIRPCSIS